VLHAKPFAEELISDGLLVIRFRDGQPDDWHAAVFYLSAQGVEFTTKSIELCEQMRSPLLRLLAGNISQIERRAFEKVRRALRKQGFKSVREHLE
jgi:hypothetical protein